MFRYVVRRIITLVPLIIILSILVFLYIHLMPGDPVQAMLGQYAPPGQVEQVRHELGLDRPLYVQFTDWVVGLMHGDLGTTLGTRQPITPILIDRIPATLELAAAAFIISIAVGLPTGFIAGLMKDTKYDYVFSVFALAGLSTPSFWMGQIFVLVVALEWRVLPPSGYIPISENLTRNLAFLALPALTLGLVRAPYIAKMTRTAVVETMQEPFVDFARAKGLRRKTILLRYVWRHVIPEISVVLGLHIAGLLGGSIIIEELFNWPGMGRLLVGAVIERDYFMVQATVLLYAIIVIWINLLGEIAHGWLDKRVRLE